jgi:hypothetical protein
MNFLCGALFGFLMAIGSLWLLFFLLGRDDKVETAPGAAARSRTLRYTLGLITLTF